MDNLTHTEWQKILRSIEVLNADIESNNLAKRLTEAVNHLVSSEIISFDIFDRAGIFQGNIVYQPLAAVSAGEVEIFAEHVHEHPVIEAVFVKQRYEALTFTDCMPRRVFENTALYNEFYRRVGVADQITLALPVAENDLVCCALSRSRRNFKKEEISMMNLLKPHLTAAIRNSWLLDHIRQQAETWKSVLDHGEHGIIVLSPEGGLEFLSSRAIQILERHFQSDKLSGNHLPLSFWNWISLAIRQTENLHEYAAPVEPLIVKNDDEELKVEFCFDTNSRAVTLLLKTRSLLSPAKLLPLGVTKTEAKILYRIAMGKTNAEIALLCNISARTVQKHIEHICDKLGAENRTAAAMRAVEFIRSLFVFAWGATFAEHF